MPEALKVSCPTENKAGFVYSLPPHAISARPGSSPSIVRNTEPYAPLAAAPAAPAETGRSVHHNGRYTIFDRVVQGMELVDRIRRGAQIVTVKTAVKTTNGV